MPVVMEPQLTYHIIILRWKWYTRTNNYNLIKNNFRYFYEKELFTLSYSEFTYNYACLLKFIFSL